MKLSDITNNIYVIHLLHRKDRADEVEKQAWRFGFQFTYVDAIDGSKIQNSTGLRNGELGLLIGYQQLLLELQRRNVDEAIIFEDDFAIEDDFEERLETSWPDLPEWDGVMLGHNGSFLGAGYIPCENVTNNIVRVYSSFCCHALALKKNLFQPFLDEICKFDAPLDVMFCRLQQQHRIFAFQPSLIKQRDSHSDIILINPHYNEMGIFNS